MKGDPCPIGECGSLRKGEMCAAHWRKVSAATRNAVWDTWKAWKANLTDVARMHAYSAARDDARQEAAA